MGFTRVIVTPSDYMLLSQAMKNGRINSASDRTTGMFDTGTVRGVEEEASAFLKKSCNNETASFFGVNT